MRDNRKPSKSERKAIKNARKASAYGNHTDAKTWRSAFKGVKG